MTSIVGVGELCGRMRARSLDLFEQLGAWIRTTDDPALQRLFATASHRHAWHAELWAQRCPTIPAVDLDATTAAHRRSRPEPADRAALYQSQLDELLGDLAEIATTIDPELDPATTRVLQLVTADLTEQHAALG